MRFTDYMRGSIFGLVITAIAFAFAFSRIEKQPTPAKSQAEPAQVNAKGNKPEVFWETTWNDPTTFFTLCLVLVGGVQAGFFVWQLDLIRRGLADTKDAAEASKEQARLARESLIASQRAWIKVTDIKLHEPLYVRDGKARTAVSFKLHNVGNAPGLQIAPWIRLGVVRRDGMHIERFNKECDEQRYAPPFQAFLFPGETFPPSDRVIAYPARINKEDLEAGIHDDGGIKHIMPLIMGCVLYKFPTDQKRFHQTRFMIEIQRAGLARITLDQPRPIYLNELSLDEISWEDYSHAT